MALAAFHPPPLRRLITIDDAKEAVTDKLGAISA
jgi:hypothetical protein